MSDLIVSKPFLRGSKRYRRGEPAPTDLDKVTQDEYLRLGLVGKNRITAAALAPSTTKPAGPSQTSVPSSGRKRESARPKDVKVSTEPPAAPPDTAGATSVGAAVVNAGVTTSQAEGSVHTSAQDAGASSGAAADAATGAEASGATTNQADAPVHTSAQDSAETPAADPLAESGAAQPEA